MGIDANTWQIMLLNLPNFAGFILAVWILDRRLSSLENLLEDVLSRCLPDDND